MCLFSFSSPWRRSLHGLLVDVRPLLCHQGQKVGKMPQTGLWHLPCNLLMLALEATLADGGLVLLWVHCAVSSHLNPGMLKDLVGCVPLLGVHHQQMSHQIFGSCGRQRNQGKSDGNRWLYSILSFQAMKWKPTHPHQHRGNASKLSLFGIEGQELETSQTCSNHS